MKAKPKETVVRFRTDEDDRRRIVELAEHYALTPSSLIRMLLKKEHDTHATEQD